MAIKMLLIKEFNIQYSTSNKPGLLNSTYVIFKNLISPQVL